MWNCLNEVVCFDLILWEVYFDIVFGINDFFVNLEVCILVVIFIEKIIYVGGYVNIIRYCFFKIFWNFVIMNFVYDN